MAHHSTTFPQQIKLAPSHEFAAQLSALCKELFGWRTTFPPIKPSAFAHGGTGQGFGRRAS